MSEDAKEVFKPLIAEAEAASAVAAERVRLIGVIEKAAAEEIADPDSPGHRKAFARAAVALAAECRRLQSAVIAFGTEKLGLLAEVRHLRAADAAARAELERMQARVAELEHALELAVKVADEAWGYWDSDQDSKVGKRLAALAGHLKGYSADVTAIHAARAKPAGPPPPAAGPVPPAPPAPPASS